MAQRKTVRMDDEIKTVNNRSTLKDVVSANAKSVTTSQGEVIDRDQFRNAAVPSDFRTNFTTMNKGGE